MSQFMSDHSELVFDYIICGGGTSGAVIANRLAINTTASILLVEAGRDSGLVPNVLVPGKYVQQLEKDVEGLWCLPTVPQKELNNRELVFIRGKQLGGSTAVNYMALARGPRVDYDEWARLTGDENWRWNNALRAMNDLEDFNPKVPEGFEDLANPLPTNHGNGGPLKIGFGDEMTPGVRTFVNACLQTGIELCLDNNSGDPVGVGLAQFNTRDGVRSYAANAFLGDKLRANNSNLQIITNSLVDKIHFDGSRATGVRVRDQKKSYDVQCNQEVILCGGTFKTPQMLMLSGIGPDSHLTDHGIETIVDLPGVGQNMLDHSILTVEYRVLDFVPDHGQIFENKALLEKAETEYAADRKGAHAVFGTSGSVAFPKIQALFESTEFQDLDSRTQKFMLEETRPSAEIWLGSGPAVAQRQDPSHTFVTHELLLQNNLSRGSVCLRSNNPADPVVIDPNYLEHPYDKRIAIETVRKSMEISKAKAYEDVIQEMVHGPKGIDDQSILDFVRSNLGQGYHSVGTCRMAAEGDHLRVVDSNFAVIGTKGLRVADLSVCPILTCNHTQMNAYLIGERCSEILLQDWEEGSFGR